MPSKTLRSAAILATALLILAAAHWTATRIRAKATASSWESAQLGTTFVVDERFDKDLQGEIAETLKAQKAPRSRLAAFHQFDTPEFRLHGWIARPIEVDAEQSLVKLRVSPMLTSISGAATTIPTAHDETYRYRDG